jgi:MFS family permease
VLRRLAARCRGAGEDAPRRGRPKLTTRGLIRRFVVLRALRWLPLGIALPFLILLPQARGIELSQLGLIFAVHSVVAIVLEVPSGGLADAVGRKSALVTGGALMLASLLVFAIATAIAAYMLAVAALAAGRALMSGSLEAWFVDELHRVEPDAALHRPLAAGSTAEGVGTALGAAIGGFMPLLPLGFDTTGDALLVRLSTPLLVGVVASLVFVVALLVLVHEPPRRRSAGWRGGAADTIAVTREGLGVARRSRNVRLLLGVAAVLGLVMSMTEVLWPTRLEELVHVDTADAAPLFGLLAAASLAAFSVGSALSPRLARRTGKRRAYAGAYVVLGATLALLGIAPVAALFCAVFLAYFAAIGVAEPLHYEILHDATGASTRATVMSVDGLVSQAGGLGGNLLLVPLAAATSFGVAWGLAAAITIVAAACAAATRTAAEPATPRPRPAAPSGAA